MTTRNGKPQVTKPVGGGPDSSAPPFPAMPAPLTGPLAEVRQQGARWSPGQEYPPGSMIMYLASIADDTPAWGQNVQARDFALRRFWINEPVLASAIYSMVARNAAFSWTLDGPPRRLTASLEMLQSANYGAGWQNFCAQISTDLFTQDNGAFIEIIRTGPRPEDPPIGIAQLDAGSCRRTGVPDWPVIYTDLAGRQHRMGPHQVITLEEFPSPIERMFGVQLCAVSRVLLAAKTMRDILVHSREKMSGQKPNAVYIVNGVQATQITQAMADHRDSQSQQGFTRYIAPVIMSSIDPTIPPKVEKIELAGLPENFNMDDWMRWYINQLALGFGADYQDFAPLPGRSIGSSTQSMVLHDKARGKGPALFMKLIEHKFNFHGLLPKSVQFRYQEKDAIAQREDAEVFKMVAEAYAGLTSSIGGTPILTPAAARQEMVDKGWLSQATFDAMQSDLTQDVTVTDEDTADTTQERQANAGTLGGAPNTTSTNTEDAAPGEFSKGKRFKTRQRRIPRHDFADAERLKFEAAMAAAMGPALRQAGERFMAKIQRGKSLFISAKDLPSDLFDPSLWASFQDDMTSAMTPFVQQVGMGAADYNAKLGLGVSLDKVNAEVLAYTRNYLTKWWGEIDRVTRDNLREALANWQASGLGKRGLPDLVTAIEPMFGEDRARRIAVTEVTQLFDEGNMLAHVSAGVEKEMFQTSEDELVCPICAPLDGKVFPTTQGPRPVKDTHIGCRCVRSPMPNDTPLS